MKNINKILFLTLFTALILPPFDLNLFSKEDVIAKVNDKPVLYSDFEKKKQMLMEQYSEFSPEFLNQKDADEKIARMALDNLISEELIRQEAEKNNIKVYDREIENGIWEIKSRFSVDREGNKLSEEKVNEILLNELKKQNLTYNDFREKVRRDLMARKLIEKEIKAKIQPPNEKELKEFFNKIKSIMEGKKENLNIPEKEISDYTEIASKFKDLTAERIRLSHIFVKPKGNDIVSKNEALKKIKDIKKMLDEGQDFYELAEKYSDDKETARRGGDIGYVIRGMLPESIEKVAFKLRVGEMSDVIESDMGYHIIQLTEKKMKTKLRFDMVKNELANIYMQKKFAEELEKFTEELKKKAKIEIFDSSLK